MASALGENAPLVKALRLLPKLVCLLGSIPLAWVIMFSLMTGDQGSIIGNDVNWTLVVGFVAGTILVTFLSAAGVRNSAAQGIAADTEPSRMIRREPTWKRAYDADPETTRLALGYYRATLIRRTGFVGAATYALMTHYLLSTGHALLLVLALLMSVLIFANFPTRSRIEHAIETGRRAVRDAAS